MKKQQKNGCCALVARDPNYKTKLLNILFHEGQLKFHVHACNQMAKAATRTLLKYQPKYSTLSVTVISTAG
jgi:uncharacterized UBP type Zn finger protein